MDPERLSTIAAIPAIMSTIQVGEETKEKLRSFGSKGETYEQIINKLYDIAVSEQLRTFLTEKDAVPIDEAIARARAKWRS
jgi:hypothetical protein